MRKTLISTAVALATLPIGASVAVAEDLPISANISIVSDYAFRGISQNNQRPALQGGLDYEHDSGLYAGFWASNVSWLSDLKNDDGVKVGASNSIETNFYAGYAGEVGPFGFDVGLLQYYYPGSYGGAYKAEGNKKPHTLEGYVGLSWEFISFTYSHSFTNLFGTPKSKGSKYYDLSASYEIVENLSLDAHYGYSSIKKADNYKDWSLGATYSYSGFDFGLHYVNTNIKRDRLADDRVILSISKVF